MFISEAFLSLCDGVGFPKKPIVHDDSRLIAPGDIFVLHDQNTSFLDVAMSSRPSFVLFRPSCKDALLSFGELVVLCTTKEDACGALANGKVGAIDVGQERVDSILSAFYGSAGIVPIAITGTNGKTSTTSFVRQMLTEYGCRSASIEAGNIVVGGDLDMPLGHGLTTPSIYDMHKTMYVGERVYGAKAIAFEASSHGIEQGRIDGVNVKIAAFTNLSQDHLDYHHTMEAYFDSKKKLFEVYLSGDGVAVLNADIPEFITLKAVCDGRGVKVISYGRTGGDILLTDSKPTFYGQVFTYSIYGKSYRLEVPFFGAFQGLNLACAIGACIAQTDGKILEEVERLAGSLRAPQGRMQPVLDLDNKATGIYVDYAHTPDAIGLVLGEVKASGVGRVITVFGCGGDRDPLKRPLMGKAAVQFSDLVFVTDDNPRSEDPAVIRKQIIDDLEDGDLHKITEITTGRADAIAAAVKEKRPEDVVVILGKGAEKYQIIGKDKLPFDDYKVAYDAFFSK